MPAFLYVATARAIVKCVTHVRRFWGEMRSKLE